MWPAGCRLTRLSARRLRASDFQAPRTDHFASANPALRSTMGWPSVHKKRPLLPASGFGRTINIYNLCSRPYQLHSSDQLLTNPLHPLLLTCTGMLRNNSMLDVSGDFAVNWVLCTFRGKGKGVKKGWGVVLVLV